MTEQEIKDKAKDVYIRCFDDDINYPCVLEALEIAIRESAEEKIADIKANCDLAIEGRDVKIMELETENNKLLDVINNQDVKIADLEQQIEKMKCCGNCIHCKYDPNEESNEYCAKHQQVVNIAIRPCCEWELAK